MSRMMCAPIPLKKWTIQVFVTKRDDHGKAFRATSCYQFEAKDLASAYAHLKIVKWDEPVVYGAMLPGWHIMK